MDIVYVATINVPGYLSESDPFYSTDPAECWSYLLDELERSEDYSDESAVRSDDTASDLRCRARVAAMSPMASAAVGTVCGPTPAYRGEHDLGLAYTVDVTSDVRWDGESDTWVEQGGE